MLAAPFTSVKDVFSASFPTRTVETHDFAFDPSTGEIRGTKDSTREPYHLVVHGLVEEPLKLSYAELRELPSVTQVSDFHCVEGWTVPHVRWSGFRFSEILELVKPGNDARYVVFHALGKTGSRPSGQGH